MPCIDHHLAELANLHGEGTSGIVFGSLRKWQSYNMESKGHPRIMPQEGHQHQAP